MMHLGVAAEIRSRSRSPERSAPCPAVGSHSSQRHPPLQQASQVFPPLQLGDAVQLEGLRALPELNGAKGSIVLYDSTACRWHVRLPSGDVKALRRENLVLLHPMPRSEGAVSSQPVATAPAQGAPVQDRRDNPLGSAAAQGWVRSATADRGHWEHSPQKEACGYEPIAFVAAAEPEESRRGVEIIDPKGLLSDDDSPEPPMRIRPPVHKPRKEVPVKVAPHRPAPAPAAPAPCHAEASAATQAAYPGPAPTPSPPPAAAASTGGGGGGGGGGAVAAQQAPTSTAASAASAPATAGGNLTLTSEKLQAELRARKEAAAKRQEAKKQLQEERNKILAKLTQQVQHCLLRLQDEGLDDSSREKYQDMMQALQEKLAKIKGMS